MAFTGRTDLVDLESAFLCSQHFGKHDYENVYMKGQRRLCKSAVPSIREVKSAQQANDKEARAKIVEELLKEHGKSPGVSKKTSPVFIKREAIDIPASPTAESSDQQYEIYISDGDSQSMLEEFVPLANNELIHHPEVTNPQPVYRCCVPNCKNFLQEWFAPFPTDLGLLGRWRDCIEAGCGQLLDSMAKLRQNGAVPVVCSMHFLGFDARDPSSYQQPTLYFRDDIVVEVDRCCLCSRMHIKENMIEKDASFTKKCTIEQLVTSYFGPTYFNEKATEEYLCEECVVKLDMIFRFQQQTVNAQQRNGVLQYRMSQEKIKFQQNRFEQGFEVKQESIETIVVDNSPVHESEVFSLSDSDDEPVKNTSVDNYDILKEQLKESEKADRKEKIRKSRLTCFLCKICYDNSALLLSHLLMVHDEEEFTCHECSTTFKDSPNFNAHLARHDPVSRPLKCGYCTLRFAQKSTKTKHQVEAHSSLIFRKPVIRKTFFVCSSCGKKFRDRTAIERHELFHHKGLPVAQCDICNSSFASRRNLKRHIMVVHRGDRPYQCKFCKICYKTSQLLLDHVNENHRAEKLKDENHAIDTPPSYCCKVCNEAFVSRRMLARHQRKHESSKTASRKITPAETRVRRIGGGSKYQNICKLCEAAFPKGAEIIEHFITNHPGQELVYYPCSVCGDIFFNKKQLYVHSNAHTDKYTCELCDKQHSTNLNLHRHKSFKHGVPLPDEFIRECPHCGKKCLKGMYYMRHVKSHLQDST